MITSVKCTGIIPGDLVLKTAIEAALTDLRNNPFLLDYLFNWYPLDDLSANAPFKYGDTERARAKKWFLEHEIFVSINTRTDDLKFPMFSIGLQSSQEAEMTLGDVDYEISEQVAIEEIVATPAPILGPFTPQSYDPTTGKVVLPTGMTTANVFVNMILLDN